MPKSNLKKESLSIHLDDEYIKLFSEIKKRLQTGRLRAAIVVNRELIQFYWKLVN